MNLRQPLIIAAAILFIGFSAAATYQAFGILGLIFLLLVTALLAIAVLITFRFRAVLIDEMEVGVIFNRINNSFCRFEVSPDPKPGHNCRNYSTPSWLPFGRRMLIFNDPYFVRLRWYEEMTGTIPKKSQTAKGKLENVRTVEGVPLTIEWKVSYTVDVNLIPDSLKYKMARALPENSDKMVAGKVEKAIKHLVELRTIQSLYELGAIQKLEQELSQRVSRQLSQPVNLGFKDIPPKDISLGPILMPTEVEKALELAHQRKIQAETAAGALIRLQQAISSFSQRDMHHLAELERLRILDEKDIKSLSVYDIRH